MKFRTRNKRIEKLELKSTKVIERKLKGKSQRFKDNKVKIKW